MNFRSVSCDFTHVQELEYNYLLRKKEKKCTTGLSENIILVNFSPYASYAIHIYIFPFYLTRVKLFAVTSVRVRKITRHCKVKFLSFGIPCYDVIDQIKRTLFLD